jgi:multidrug efflux pump subunit AcrA (membrane-fusion protein)
MTLQTATSQSEPITAGKAEDNGSAALGKSRLPGRTRRGRTRYVLLGIGGAAVLIVGLAAFYFLRVNKLPFNGPTWTIKREKLVLTIVERGTLESADNKELVCRVKAKSPGGTASTIKWLVDEGKYVKKDETCIKLDDSSQQDQLQDQKIKVAQAKADWDKAEAEKQIQLIDNKNQIQAAVNAYIIARLNLVKYVGANWQDSPEAIAAAVGLLSTSGNTGPAQAVFELFASNKVDCDYQADLQDALGKIKLAQSDGDGWLERAAWSRRMWKLGFMSKTQADSDQSRLDSAEYSLRKVETDLKTLEIKKNVTERDLRNKLGEADLNLLKARLAAKANLDIKESARSTTKSVYDQQEDKKKDIEDEITKCTLRAPQDGLVVYYIAESTKWGQGRQAIIAQGENVTEGQKLMQIPDLNHMLVNTKVHEAMVSHVSKGQRAKIRVDALPGRTLSGFVKEVKNVASPDSWLASDVKLYQTLVVVEDNLEDLNLKPQMSAEVTIAADESTTEVLAIPIQSVIGNLSMGYNRKCFVIGADKQPHEREIVVGMNNDKLVEVRSGLEEGERVVLNAASLITEKSEMKASVPQERKSRQGGPGMGKGKGKGGKGGPGGPADKKAWMEKGGGARPQ